MCQVLEKSGAGLVLVRCWGRTREVPEKLRLPFNEPSTRRLMTREPVQHGGANISVIGRFVRFLVHVMDVLVGMCLKVPNGAYGGAPSNGRLEGWIGRVHRGVARSQISILRGL